MPADMPIFPDCFTDFSASNMIERKCIDVKSIESLFKCLHFGNFCLSGLDSFEVLSQIK